MTSWTVWENNENRSQNSLFASRGLNTEPPEYERKLLFTPPRRCILQFRFAVIDVLTRKGVGWGGGGSELKRDRDLVARGISHIGRRNINVSHVIPANTSENEK
jgi:hypothetical protein